MIWILIIKLMRKFQKLILTIILSVIGGVALSAQNSVKVSGVVTSADDGLPMIGVAVTFTDGAYSTEWFPQAYIPIYV